MTKDVERDPLSRSLLLAERAKKLSGGSAPLMVLLLIAIAFAAYSQWQLMQKNVGDYPTSFLADISNASYGMISLVSAEQCSVPAGKLKIQAFYEPFCSSCGEQAALLNSVSGIYSQKLVIEKVCTAFKSDSSYLICSKPFVEGASYDQALAFVCAQNGTVDSGCISTITGTACADLNIASNCTIENMRAAVKRKQDELGYSVLAPEAQKLSDSYRTVGQTNLPAPTLVFNCAFKREGMFASPALERATLADILDVFMRRV
ncbi:hypothetical protein HY546_00930 [archaeon]|nr:hypothetical protein [archaeon]